MGIGFVRWGFVATACLAFAPGYLGRPGLPPRSEPPPTAAEIADQAAAEAAQLPRLRSLIISQGGEIVLERYYGGARRDAPMNIKSASKSVISALVGIAVDRGLIAGVSDPIAPYFPGLLGDDDQRKKAVTIEDLLTMRSGLVSTSGRNYGAFAQSASWVGWVLRNPMIGEPGGPMNYSTGNTHLLSAILTQATGTSTRDFAQETLAGPLGFHLGSWQRDPEGIYFGGNNMAMTPRQMLAFGELYLNGGEYGGKRILSRKWVEASFIPRGRSHRSGRLYGYGWWIRELGGLPVYYAWGYGGQFIFVVPRLDLVVVTTSATDGGDDRRGHLGDVYDLVERQIIAPLNPWHGWMQAD